VLDGAVAGGGEDVAGLSVVVSPPVVLGDEARPGCALATAAKTLAVAASAPATAHAVMREMRLRPSSRAPEEPMTARVPGNVESPAKQQAKKWQSHRDPAGGGRPTPARRDSACDRSLRAQRDGERPRLLLSWRLVVGGPGAAVALQSRTVAA
jgi:hypothetical protein